MNTPAHPSYQRLRRGVCTAAIGVAALIPIAVVTPAAPRPGAPAAPADGPPPVAWEALSLGIRDDPESDGLSAQPAAPVPGPPPGPVPVAGQANPAGQPVPAARITGIPGVVLQAYQRAARPDDCGLHWSVLAAIGRIESGHARGGQVNSDGITLKPILGPQLNGDPGIAAIRDTDGGTLDQDPVWDRAVGPMQFIPDTWRRYTWPGANPHNVFDASVAAARYLCSGGGDLTQRDQLSAAVFRYNHSASYVQWVLSWADAYAAGVTPLPSTVPPAPAPVPPSPTVPPTPTPTSAPSPGPLPEPSPAPSTSPVPSTSPTTTVLPAPSGTEEPTASTTTTTAPPSEPATTSPSPSTVEPTRSSLSVSVHHGPSTEESGRTTR